MGVVAYKNRSSDLRRLLKVFKLRFDDLSTLRRYEPSIRRLLFLNTSPENQQWRGEAFHQLALMYENDGDIEAAEKHYRLSIETFADHERLGLARVMRDYGLFVALHHDREAGLMQIKQALALHEDDLNSVRGHRQKIKGQRQQRITESYIWRARLLVDRKDKDALGLLVKFALTECQDCCLRDQQRAIEFVAPYTRGVQRQALDARLIEINTRRRKLSGVAWSMAKFVIDAELMVAGKIIRTLIRKG